MHTEKLEGDLGNGIKFQLIVTGEDLIEVLKERNKAFRRILGMPDDGIIRLTPEFMENLEREDLERSWKLPPKGPPNS